MQSNTLELREANRDVLRYTNIDELLGEAKNRYFGSGYLRTGYSYAQPDDSDRGDLNFVASVIYPQDWSVKKGVPQDAHLSTVDAIYLAAMGAEEALKRAFGKDLTGLQPVLESLSLKSGSEAHIDLDTVGVFAHVKSPEGDIGNPMNGVDVEGIVGNMKFSARFSLTLLASAANDETYSVAGAASLLGMHEARACERSFAGGASTLVDVEATDNFRSISSRLSRVHGGLSVALAVVIPAQLAQVAIYMSEGGRRDGSNTLWMRNYSIERADAPAAEERATLATRSYKQVRQASQTWGVYQFLGQVVGWKVAFTFAHAQVSEDSECAS